MYVLLMNAEYLAIASSLWVATTPISADRVAVCSLEYKDPEAFNNPESEELYKPSGLTISSRTTVEIQKSSCTGNSTVSFSSMLQRKS